MITKGAIAKGIWDVLTAAYHQQGRTKVEVPTMDVVEILAAVAGNVVSQVNDAGEREKIVRALADLTDKYAKAVRQRPSIHIPSRSPLILPN